MPTISSISNNTYTLYKMAEKQSTEQETKADDNSAKTSSEKSSTIKVPANVTIGASTASNLLNTFFGAKADKGNAGAQLYASSSSSSDMSSLFSVTNGMSKLLKSYQTAKSTFDTEYGGVMSDLEDAVNAMKNTSFDVGKDAILSDGTTEGENGTPKYNEALSKAVSNVTDLVDAYNDAIDLFTNSSSVSAKMGAVANAFSDTTYHADQYRSVGISVDSETGKLSLDTGKLAKAIADDPVKAEAVLGKDGFTGKAESHMEFAKSQKGSLFPSSADALDDEMKLASMYTGSALLNINTFTTAGNLLDLMF